MPAGIPHALHAPLRLWQALQVELHGQYSLDRLHALVKYSQGVRWFHVASVLVVTPMPCLLSIIGADALPLRVPGLGVYHQGLSYWARCFFSSVIVTGTVIIEFYHSSMLLPMGRAQFFLATLCVTVGTTLTMFLLGVFVGFPVPFLFQAVAPFWITQLAAALLAMWMAALRSSSTARADFFQFVALFLSQFAMILVYPLISYVFSILSGTSQTAITMSMPMLKLALRNWAGFGAARAEDLTPVYVVFSVDVFHALFLSCAMQLSTGIGTFLVATVVDVVQNGVAVFEVFIIAKRLRQLAERINKSNRTPKRTVKNISPSIICVASALAIENQHVREHADVALPKHQRRQNEHALIDIIIRSLSRRRSSGFASMQFEPVVRSRVVVPHHPSPSGSIGIPVADERVRVEYVRLTLRLLHMVEFYMLVEFTEFIVAVVYAVYLMVMSRLPNRAYYVQLREMTDAQLQRTVGAVAKFASLELLSFVMLSYALDRLVYFSTLKQLAFALEKQWVLVQALLVLWVFFVIQLSLDHFGNDYTFHFAWLHHPRV